MTVFFALWPPASVAAALHAWARELSGQSKARVMREETLHITLAYVGRVPEEDLPRLVEAGRRACLSPHALDLDRVERWGHNKILWAGPADAPAALVELVETLRSALQEAGFSVDRKPFRAHMTLLRDAAPVRDWPSLPPLAWRVEEFVLARSDQSQTSRSGSSPSTRTDYHVLERFEAAAAVEQDAEYIAVTGEDR